MWLWLVTLIDNGLLMDKQIGEDVQRLLLIHPIAKRTAPQTRFERRRLGSISIVPIVPTVYWQKMSADKPAHVSRWKGDQKVKSGGLTGIVLRLTKACLSTKQEGQRRHGDTIKGHRLRQAGVRPEWSMMVPIMLRKSAMKSPSFQRPANNRAVL
jgi:hypothetical protein